VKIVDILGDDAADLMPLQKRGQGPVPGIRFGARKHALGSKPPPPGFAAHLSRAQEAFKLDWLQRVPHPSRAAEIRDAGFGRDAGASENHSAARFDATGPRAIAVHLAPPRNSGAQPE